MRSHSSKASSKGVPLEQMPSYRCPACGYGDFTKIALMDVWGCSFCQHLFSLNFHSQTAQLADTLPPRLWYWRDNRWQVSPHDRNADTLIGLFVGMLLVAPVTIIGALNYIFPPLEHSEFPAVWFILTWVSHGSIALWLLAEYHRWPWYIAGGIRLRRLKERFL